MSSLADRYSSPESLLREEICAGPVVFFAEKKFIQKWVQYKQVND